MSDAPRLQPEPFCNCQDPGDNPGCKLHYPVSELEQQVESLRAALATANALMNAALLGKSTAEKHMVKVCAERYSEKQRADALEASLKLAISAGEYVVRIVGDCGKSGDSPNPNVKSDWLGTAMHCYVAMSWLNTARDVIDAARKPVPQEPAK